MLTKGNITAIPVLHYTMECAQEVRRLFLEVQPDCVVVEMAETMQLQLLHAASRLPDISVVTSYDADNKAIHYMIEPCDPCAEALRSALEANIPAYCIDLDVDGYPDVHDRVPDPYAIQRIGLAAYYEQLQKKPMPKTALDHDREIHMARRLKELSLQHNTVLFIAGMSHIDAIFQLLNQNHFPIQQHVKRDIIELSTLTEESTRDVLAECGWFSTNYEEHRERGSLPIDRQKVIYSLFLKSAEKYTAVTTNPFPGYHLRNIMKFLRNYSLIHNQLMPDLFKILTAAKSCVDHNYAYEVWELATRYLHRKNIDNLPEKSLSLEDVWGQSKSIRFHIKEQNPKGFSFQKRKKYNKNIPFEPPGPFSICSYQPEDLVIEEFGKFLQKKGTQLLTEEGARSILFSTSLEDGVDTRETIRHWFEKKLYVKVKGKPTANVGSVVVVFTEDEKQYPWTTTWLGEHDQESDMALFATQMETDAVGPGIYRCQYGGFLMSYPPRRMADVWTDPDYQNLNSKAEVLLAAGIDYAVETIVVYVAAHPPRQLLKSYAKRFGKKLIYVPIGHLSSVTVNHLRKFHVLDGHDKRAIADDYII